MKKPLDLSIDESSATPVYEQLANQMRKLICAKTFEPTEQIPSIRVLAEQLNVSPTTVRRAFQMLIDEGWLTQQRGAGTYVSSSVELQQKYLAEPDAKRATHGDIGVLCLSEGLLEGTWAEALLECESARGTLEACAPGLIDLSSTAGPVGENAPVAAVAMTKYISDALTSATSLTDPAGSPELRDQVASWIAVSRSLQCTAADILITSGRQQARSMIARLFGGEGQTIVFEEPCNPSTRELFQSFGWTIETVPVDESGIVIEELERINSATALWLRPSSQYPTGAVLSKMRRERIAAWAENANAIVIEDDAGCDFSFDSRVTGAVSSFVSPERSIYIGSFSHVLPGAWQISFVVVPLSMREAFYRLKLVSDRCTSPVAQNVLLAMFHDGQLQRTVTRLQRDYSRMREVLLESLNGFPANSISFTPVKGGLHQAVWFTPAIDDDDVVERCRERGALFTPLSSCFAETPARCGVLINFSTLDEQALKQGIAILKQALYGS